MESVSQRYITIGLYLSAILFYSAAIFVPMSENNLCDEGHEILTYIYYGIYMLLSGAMELAFLIHLQRKVDDKDAFRLNKFHLIKIVTG